MRCFFTDFEKLGQQKCKTGDLLAKDDCLDIEPPISTANYFLPEILIFNLIQQCPINLASLR
jgi:hypothetical protein